MGPFTYFVIFSMLLGFMLSGVAIFRHISLPKSKKVWIYLGAMLIFVALVSMAFGGVGYLLAMSEVESALSKVTPGREQELYAAGHILAMIPIKVASGNILTLVVGVFTLIRGLRSKM